MPEKLVCVGSYQVYIYVSYLKSWFVLVHTRYIYIYISYLVYHTRYILPTNAHKLTASTNILLCEFLAIAIYAYS